MGRTIERCNAIAVLAEEFPLAEDDYRNDAPADISAASVEAIERLFSSRTQAYRQALIGCAIARIVDPTIDIRRPATEHGEDSFSGRSLDENVIIPFLRERAIPIAASSPYLSSLRGGARFIVGGEPRIQRDKEGFAALVTAVDSLRALNEEAAKKFLRHLLRRFIKLRESANIPLKRIAKPNLEQLHSLISGLLTVQSGGRIPALLAVAMFQALSEAHHLEWDIEYQGINVADKASGAVGDITIRKGPTIILGVEVTERAVDQGRVTLIFEHKVSPSGLEDYLFITTTKPERSARAAARNYTAVGHEMNFVPLAPWIIHNLSTIGPGGRALFQAKLLDLVEGAPAEIKVAWNAQMDVAIGVSAGA